MPGRHNFSNEILGSRYHLDRRIGYGAMASIYAATDQTTKGCVAVKVLHPEHDTSADSVRRFTQEGQLAAQIRHPNLVPAHDLGWVGGRHYLVMELVEGERLPAMMMNKPLPWEQATRFVLDLLAGLAALHARGVAHRDVSPYNCLIEPTDNGPRARLFDLGNARVIEETSLVLTQPDASETITVYGTSRYIAPERLRGGAGDFRADVYSVGALWYTMLTSKKLPDPLEGDPSAPLDTVPLPPRLLAVLRGALDGRDRRHHSAASMAEAIKVAMQAKPRKNHRAWLLAPAVGSLAILIGLTVHAWPRHREEAPTSIAVDVSAPAIPTSSLPVGTILAAKPPAVAAPDEPPAVATPAADEPTTPIADDPPALDPPDQTPPFNLRAALVKCKAHPAARLKIEYVPGKTIKINGARSVGDVGRCVEGVFSRHPPQGAVKLTA